MYASTLHLLGEGFPHTAHIREYDNMGELLTAAETVVHQPSLGYGSIVGSYESTGTHNLEEAIELGRYGWTEGRNIISDEVEKIDVPQLTAQTILPEPFFAEAGEEPDVGRFVSGEYENMIDYAFSERPTTSIVELVVNSSIPVRMTRRHIIERGASIVGATERLQAAGYSVGVIVGATAIQEKFSGSTCFEIYVPVFRPGESVDMDSLCFAMAHPSFFRRVVLATQETEPLSIRYEMGFREGGDYGKATEMGHIPPSEHLQVVIESDVAGQGGIRGAQEVINRVAAAAQIKQAGQAN